MNKRTPLPGYRLLSSPSTKLKLKDNHYETPCIFALSPLQHVCLFDDSVEEIPANCHSFLDGLKNERCVFAGRRGVIKNLFLMIY